MVALNSHAQKQQRRALRVGAIELQLVFENNALCAVELPEEVPAELDAETLKQIVAELDFFQLLVQRPLPRIQRRRRLLCGLLGFGSAAFFGFGGHLLFREDQKEREQ